MGNVKMSKLNSFILVIFWTFTGDWYGGAGLRKSWQKAPSCRLEIMLGLAGLGAKVKWGREFRENVSLGGVCRYLLR